MPTKDGKLTEADRVALKATLDRLVPANGDLPGAGQLGLAARVEEVAADAPRYTSGLVGFLDALSLDPTAHAVGGFAAMDGEDQDEAIRSIEDSMPDVFSQFLELVYLVYYSDERVHEKIGWRTGPPQPRGWELPRFEEKVLENVREKEPFWRRTD